MESLEMVQVERVAHAILIARFDEATATQAWAQDNGLWKQVMKEALAAIMTFHGGQGATRQ